MYEYLLHNGVFIFFPGHLGIFSGAKERNNKIAQRSPNAETKRKHGKDRSTVAKSEKWVKTHR